MASLCFDLVPSRAEPSYTWTSATEWSGYLRDDQGGWWGGGKASCAAFDNAGATFSLDTNTACNRYARTVSLDAAIACSGRMSR